MTQVSAFYSKKTMFGLTSLVQTFCVHRDKSVLKIRLTLFVLFWLEGGLAEVWQATPLSFLSHSDSTAAKKTKYREMFSQFACSLEHNMSASCVNLL